MKKLALISTSLLIATSCSTMSSYNQDSVVEKLQAEALQSNTAYEIVKSLTVEVGPRMVGSKSDPVAVKWAMEKLKQLNFDKVYKEPVEVPVWKRGAGIAQIMAPYPQNMVVTALGGSIGTGPQGIKAEIIKFNSLDELKAAKAGSLNGKIAYIDQVTERHMTGRGYSKAVGSRFYGAASAAEKGAKAVIIRSIGTAHDRFAHTGSMKYQEQIPKIPAAAISNPDADLVNAMLDMGKKVTVKLKLTSQSQGIATSYNVIGEITGSKKPEEIVLIGAHLDSWDEGTGALDDGAGVAIVTAAAKLIGELPKNIRPERTIRVVLFAAEEIGLVGAKSYLQRHKSELENHFIAAESDFGSRAIWRFDTKINPKMLDKIKHIDQALGKLQITRGHNEASGGPDVSIFPAEGVPVASLYQDGIDYFDFHHTPNDTLDKVSREGLQQCVAAYATFAYLMAQLPVSLRTNE